MPAINEQESDSLYCYSLARSSTTNSTTLSKVNLHAELLSASNYYAFGMLMPGRSYQPEDYRFGFNGQEKDDEVKGSTNSIDFKFRGYDPRLVRFTSIDPLTKKYPELTPYQFANNSPIRNIDIDGLEGYSATDGKWIDKKTNATGTAVAVTNSMYLQVQLWNKTNGEQGQAPKPGFTYVYTPYKDPAHPESKGMSPEGKNGFEGYWYAENLSLSDIKFEPKIITPSTGFGGSLDSWKKYGKSEQERTDGFITTIERTINVKQGEFNQTAEDVKTITIAISADVYDKSASGIREALQEKFPKANVLIQKLKNNSAGNTDSAFGFQYEGTKTVQKK